jgi:hypothetical protein
MDRAEKSGCCAIGLCADDFMGIKIKTLIGEGVTCYPLPSFTFLPNFLYSH